MVRTFGKEPDPAKRINLRQGREIRKIRSMRGMSASALAEAVGVSAGAISQWETGRVSAKNVHQLAVAAALDVPWSSIFGLDGEVA